MTINAIVDTLDDVPEQFKELYSEKNGKYELTGVTGFRTQADVDRLSSSLAKERSDHKGTKDKFSAFSDLDPSEVRGKLDRFQELEAAAAGKLDDEGINKLVEGRIATKLAPVERERNNFKTELEKRDQVLAQYEARDKVRAIGDAVRKACTGKIQESAMEDATMLAERMFEIDPDTGSVITKEGVGVTPGVDAAVWLTEMSPKRVHWMLPSIGGGAGGSRSIGGFTDNPFSKDGWNMTKQGALLRESPERATQMAKSAGTTVGGMRPIK